MIFAPRVHFIELVQVTASYAAFLFVLISEWFLMGGAERLTKARGEKWTKEMDYVYLSFGAVGLAFTLSRLEAVTDRPSIPELIGPIMLAMALVVRTIKTRAEVNGWNKMPEKVTRAINAPGSP
jgi:hypothetical protein